MPAGRDLSGNVLEGGCCRVESLCLLARLGTPLVFPWMCWQTSLGRGMSELLYLGCCLQDPAPAKWEKMDGCSTDAQSSKAMD